VRIKIRGVEVDCESSSAALTLIKRMAPLALAGVHVHIDYQPSHDGDPWLVVGRSSTRAATPERCATEREAQEAARLMRIDLALDAG
jgi:hypothetical protein